MSKKLLTPTVVDAVVEKVGLVAEKLKTAAEQIAVEGWKWIEVAVSFPHGATHGLRELAGTQTGKLTHTGGTGLVFPKRQWRLQRYCRYMVSEVYIS